MDPGRRRQLTRFGAPAAFLLAVTIAVLLVKSGLDGSQQQTVVVSTTTAPTTTQAPTTTKLVLTGTVGTTTVANAQYYTVQSGDTLGTIAAKYSTTVEQLLTLNPGVDPSALQPGQRIRVG